MTTLKPLDKWLRRSQTNQCIRIVALSWSVVGRASLDVPATWCVNSEDWNLGIAQCLNDGRERLSDFATEGETKDRVYDIVGLVE